MGSTGGGAVAVARGTRECEVRAAPISMGNKHCAHTAVQWMVWPGSPSVPGPHVQRRAVTPDGEEIHDEVRVPSA